IDRVDVVELLGDRVAGDLRHAADRHLADLAFAMNIQQLDRALPSHVDLLRLGQLGRLRFLIYQITGYSNSFSRDWFARYEKASGHHRMPCPLRDPFMTKLIIFTDLHMVPEGASIIGLDPYQRLLAGIDHVNRYHADADGVIVMGDLTHRADRPSYERLKTLLDRLVPPLAITIGNHDRRDIFLEVFADAVHDEDGFVQRVVDFPDCRAVLLDTLFAPPYDYPRSHAGFLCAKR